MEAGGGSILGHACTHQADTQLLGRRRLAQAGGGGRWYGLGPELADHVDVGGHALQGR